MHSLLISERLKQPFWIMFNTETETKKVDMYFRNKPKPHFKQKHLVTDNLWYSFGKRIPETRFMYCQQIFIDSIIYFNLYSISIISKQKTLSPTEMRKHEKKTSTSIDSTPKQKFDPGFSFWYLYLVSVAHYNWPKLKCLENYL